MTLHIAALTQTGLGRADDGTLWPRCLPGEEIEPLADGSLRIVTPSPDRVAPPCRHFRTCGGCAMQHASDALVQGWKAEILRRALAAQGVPAEIVAFHTSPPRSRRRARLAARRSKKGALVGFHAKGSDLLIPVPECQLLLPALMAAFPALEELTLLVASRKAEAGLTVTDTVNGADIWVETDKDLSPDLQGKLALWAARHRIARLVWGSEPVVTLQPPVQRFGRADVVPPPGAFLQATRDGEAALTSAVLAATAGATRIADLFAGCGTFALPLAAGAEVHAVESEAAMLAALDRGWRGATGLKRVTTEARDLFRRPLEPDELARFDAVVLDPPRAGAEAQVATIAASRLRRVAMVSCNPVTFARDARSLTQAGFGLSGLTVVDQFRWSAHVEMVGTFTRT